ncbi:methyltransferase [Agrobacterium tumefaciens]|uniref:methyltransferase n=1 Tax=Agrobacterium tumefaciens TaxID=358 RepID=UPI0015740C88|nr:methyltransferase [Agrobacterium tumefaciens]
MAKLTKQQRKAHAEAEAILTKERLSEDEREFVFRNWHEGAEFINGAAGAFFTPFDLAGDFALDGAGGRVIDLCAGIGVLSYFIGERAKYGSRATDLTCIEVNPKYCEVGRKLLPDARWINADVFDWRELDLGRYDIAIGNPPFGRVRRSGNAPRYRGAEFEFHIIDIAAELADHGAFIVPQLSASFQYSGRHFYERRTSGKGIDFEKATGFRMEAGAGVDTSIYRDDWKDTNIITEIVCFDFAEARQRRAAAAERIAAKPMPAPARYPAEQLALL